MPEQFEIITMDRDWTTICRSFIFGTVRILHFARPCLVHYITSLLQLIPPITASTSSILRYNYEEHLDLPKYVGVEEYMNSKDDCECPIIVFIPSSYADDIDDDYLRNPSLDGVTIWDSTAEPDWKVWAWKNLEKTVRIVMDIPFHFEVTVNHQTINTYLQKEGKPWTKTYKIDAIQSHFDITVFPGIFPSFSPIIATHTQSLTYTGDTIYISANPQLTNQLKKVRRDSPKPTSPKPTDSAMNPTYTVHAAMDVLNVIQFEDMSWGFDDDERRQSIASSWVARRHSTTLMTHTRNLIIPQILPATHPKGFTKRKMPKGLHQRLINFYRKWYHLKADESWDHSGTQLNFYNVKTHMVSLDHDYRERDSIAHDVMKPLLLEWAHSNGHTEIAGLEFTAFYGIREYSRGASLRNHVDRVDTHVFSAVLQVAQSGVEEPWPLQVIGFDGKLYDVTLEPGEMILYEGHKLIHGRPYPFNGTRFANAFIHFKPQGWGWTTGKVWKEPEAKETLKNMHMDMGKIYR